MKLFIIALMVLAVSAHSTYEDPPDMDLLQQEDWNQFSQPASTRAFDKVAVAGKALASLVEKTYDTQDDWSEAGKKMSKAEDKIANGMLSAEEKKSADAAKGAVEHPSQVADLMLGHLGKVNKDFFDRKGDSPEEVEALDDDEAEAEAMSILAETDMEDKKQAKPKKFSTVDNLMSFKAFCIGAKDKADDILDSWDGGKGGSMSALLPFIIKYGKPSKHPFIDYAKLIAKYKAKYPIGISRYVIGNMHDSIVNGVGVVAINKPVGFTSIRHRALGLTSRPDMLRKLLVSLTKFTGFNNTAKKALGGADAAAAGAWLRKGSKDKFKTFKARVQDYYKGKVAACYKKTIKVGVNAEFKAFEKMRRLDSKAFFKQIRVQVPAGLKATGARKACRSLLPTGLQMRAIAKAKAKTWLKTKKFGMKNASAVIKAFMKARATIHIRILTGKATHAKSDMVPTAIVKGSTATKTVKLKINKVAGKWASAIIMVEGLGDFKKLTLKAGNMDGWEIQEVRVAQGKGKWLAMLAQTQGGLFDKATSKWLDMKPFNKGKGSYGLKKITKKSLSKVVSTSWSYVPNGKTFERKLTRKAKPSSLK